MVMNEEDVKDTPNQGPSLPPGIKPEAVLSFLGNISRALNELADGINQTITNIVTEGTKMEATEEGAANDETR